MPSVTEGPLTAYVAHLQLAPIKYNILTDDARTRINIILNIQAMMPPIGTPWKVKRSNGLTVTNRINHSLYLTDTIQQHKVEIGWPHEIAQANDDLQSCRYGLRMRTCNVGVVEHKREVLGTPSSKSVRQYGMQASLLCVASIALLQIRLESTYICITIGLTEKLAYHGTMASCT